MKKLTLTTLALSMMLVSNASFAQLSPPVNGKCVCPLVVAQTNDKGQPVSCAPVNPAVAHKLCPGYSAPVVPKNPQLGAGSNRPTLGR